MARYYHNTTDCNFNIDGEFNELSIILNRGVIRFNPTQHTQFVLSCSAKSERFNKWMNEWDVNQNILILYETKTKKLSHTTTQAFLIVIG